MNRMAKKDFTPETIEKVRVAANFRCCLCRENFCFHTHHIDPEKNDFHNAIPLCEDCHLTHGPNPSKQKFLIQARDEWYKEVRDRKDAPDIKFIEEIFKKIEQIERKSFSKKELIQELEPLISEQLSKMESAINTFYKKGDNDNVIKYVDYLSSSSTCTAYLLKSINNVDEAKKEIKLNDIFPAGSIKDDNKCPFCSFDLNQLFYIPNGKCPNCDRYIW